jgi:pimeloyl-ACP methyl ester carboxylesterase
MQAPALPPALPADAFDLGTSAGRVHVYRAQPAGPADAAGANGSWPPLLLIHSVNAAASAAEVAPLFAHYRQHRVVYALDLPGYGLSDRSERDYTPRMMTHAVAAVVTLMREREHCGAVDVLAVSLACEFAARAQTEAPDSIARLALVSPTGLRHNQRRDGPPGATLGVPWLYRLFTRPFWTEGIFRTLTRPGVIRYFLRRTWGSRTIDEDLWRYAVITTRQPGARHAPFRFVSAYLFSRDIHTVFKAVNCPVWVSMATRGDFTDYRGRTVLQGHTNWQFHPVPGGALPYFEADSNFVALLDRFWASPGTAALN